VFWVISVYVYFNIRNPLTKSGTFHMGHPLYLAVVFWLISVYFNIRNTLPKSGTFLLGHPVYLAVVFSQLNASY
jgi:hypothetical protein